jgi:hypothetical protein
MKTGNDLMKMTLLLLGTILISSPVNSAASALDELRGQAAELSDSTPDTRGLNVPEAKAAAVEGISKAASQDYAVPLGSALILPDYFQKRYGQLMLTVKVSDKAGAPTLKYLKPTTTTPKGQTIHWPKKFVFTYPRTQRQSEVKTILGAKFLELMRKEDTAYTRATDGLGMMMTLTPGTQNRALKVLERVEAYGARRLAGEKVTQNRKDEIAELWWELKFSPKNHEVVKQVRQGDLLLFAVHQTGYISQSSSFLTNLRRKLDFGHAALGLRYAGQGPEKDLYINPGAKNLENGETSLPNSEDPKVLNMVDVVNFWVWSEVQLYQRYMGVSAQPLVLNKLQTQAVKMLLPKVNGVNYGPALAFTNNCADGAGRLAMFLLPIEGSFALDGFLGIATPASVNKEEAKSFGANAGPVFNFPNIIKQNPFPQTPGTSYRDANYKDLNVLKSYKNYRAWENNWVKGFNN